MTEAHTLSTLETPALLLDPQKLKANVQRMHRHIAALGGVLRPHGKTAKSVDVMGLVDTALSDAELAHSLQGQGMTVSTLAEAEYYAAHGYRDIVYAVGIAPNKLTRVAALLRQGVKLTVLLDSLAQVQFLMAAGEREQISFGFLVEIDSDGHRAGIAADDPALLAIAEHASESQWAEFHGVLTHAGGSYDCRSVDAIKTMAEQERSAMQNAVAALHKAGFTCEVVSLGSTPTAQYAQSLEGMTEIRAGVYLFHDLVMAGLGVCQVEDIAISVLTSVIGHHSGQLIIDAGWMALSRDRGTAQQTVDQGYGVVCDEQGHVIADVIVSATNQEHGVVSHRHGQALSAEEYPAGRLLRVLPNHACATAAMFSAYQVIQDHGHVQSWPRINGW